MIWQTTTQHEPHDSYKLEIEETKTHIWKWRVVNYETGEIRENYAMFDDEARKQAEREYLRMREKELVSVS